jgi:hypothetical protein
MRDPAGGAKGILRSPAILPSGIEIEQFIHVHFCRGIELAGIRTLMKSKERYAKWTAVSDDLERTIRV